MLHIGILSDTHGYIHPSVPDFFNKVDEIWHAGDVGEIITTRKLAELKPLRAVHGNIDGQDIRIEYPKDLLFTVEDVKVLMTHIGGYPGRYDPRVRHLIEKERPKLFICGHSHILKVIFDKKYDLLHINPGAAGKFGPHKSITAVRMILENGNMRDFEVLDVPR
ncbi:MAG: metallophosphatase family protein [Bacteroidales bacterium]|jgi:hypothetical protein|nr:metallophosphatase family protein [Bacteroidales bacterium]